MVKRWAQFWIIVRQSLLAAVAGSLLYACVVSVLVFGGQAGGFHDHFLRWPSIEGLLGVALLMTPIAMPTALAITASLAFFVKKKSLPTTIGGGVAIAALVAILVFSFPIYMTTLDQSNNWQRGMLLPVMVSAAAVIIWSFGRLPDRKICCE